ncbi:MAG: hypothetical protein WD512_11155 [Candidatus Paceibacterota bacterium]
MAYNHSNYNRNVTELEMTYANGRKETFESITYPGSTSFSFQCKLNELPEDMKMTYYHSVTQYCSKKCQLIDDPNGQKEDFSLDGCCNQEKIEEEMEESKKIVYEYDKSGNEYRVIEEISNKPVRECWCKFIYDIVNTGEGIIKFGPKDNSVNHYPFNIMIKGNKIIGSSSEIEICGQITFDTKTASDVKKEKKCDFIYEDTVKSEYIKIRQWEQYSVSSVNIQITISRFSYEFILAMHDLSLRTTSSTNCQTDRNLSANDDCRSNNCWCTAYNSLRATGKFNITIPMRIIKHANPYHLKNEYMTTIEGKINPSDKDKMDISFKFTNKWIHNNNDYYSGY